MTYKNLFGGITYLQVSIRKKKQGKEIENKNGFCRGKVIRIKSTC